MSAGYKAVFGLTMALALAFGFLHIFVPDSPLDLDRLHIFLFNLCAGGAILLFHATGERRVTRLVLGYFGVSLAYAVAAFMEFHVATMLLSLPIIAMVERVRIQRFSLLPLEFFKARPVEDKFLHAALLCLSVGAAMASLVILDNEYLHLLQREKLTIDVFFLGYSFPLSLLTFSLMFTFMEKGGQGLYPALKELSSWSITLGVIVFFGFIIFEDSSAEIASSVFLFTAVLMTYALFLKHSMPVQHSWFLASGMMFLVVTASTGVLYLVEYLYPPLNAWHQQIITLHATVALYGWNLSGLFIVLRLEDFPIFKRVIPLLGIHWLTVFVLVPLGKSSALFALLALPSFGLLLGVMLFKKSRSCERAPPSNSKGVAVLRQRRIEPRP